MIKRSVLLLLAFVTTACTVASPLDQIPPQDETETAVLQRHQQTDETETAVPPISPNTPPLPVLGPAPDWDNDIWINSDRPLRLADVQGKVVLLEFWTFG